MSDKVVFLAFDNPDAPEGEMNLLGCAECRNKTFIARLRHSVRSFPTLYCAACGQIIGDFGWAPEGSDE